ncbi:MAG: EAL domain-containing protein, partial [Acidimicrobiales bacterium]
MSADVTEMDLGRAPAAPRVAVDLRAGLPGAIDRGEMSLRYQPVVGLASGRVIGVEALLRWRVAGGAIAPDAFIPVAEESDLIVPIGAWVLDQACRQWATWQKEPETSVPRMSVNVSVRQLSHPGLVATVRAALQRASMPASALCLELTESALGDDSAQLVERLHEIKALGVSMSIDDFGTGFSSLARLRDFPVDELKVDRSFITNMHVDGRDRAIVQSTVALATALELGVVAEGVETSEQLAILRTLGCGAAQGYLFSAPVPEDEVPERVRALRSSAHVSRPSAGAPATARLADGSSDAEVSFLLSLALSVVASTDLASALESVLSPVCERLGWDCAQAWTPHDGVLRCGPEWYGDPLTLSPFRTASLDVTFAPGKGLPGRAFEHRRAVWSDLATDEQFPRFEAARLSGLQTGVVAPVIADGEVVAVVEFYTRHSRPEASRTIDVLSSVVVHLGSFFERRRAQEALDGVRARLDGVFRVTDDAVVVADGNGLVSEWNSAAERMFGWDRSQIIGRSLSLIVPPDLRPAHDAGFARAAADGRLTRVLRPTELLAIHRDGSTFPVELTLSALPTGQSTAFVGLVRDITARKAAERDLVTHAARLEEFIGLLHLLLQPDSTLVTAMTAIAEGTAELCRADGAIIELRDGDEMVAEGVAGIATALAGIRLQVRGTLSGHCALTGRIERCDDTERDDRVDRDTCRRAGVRSMLVVPFAHGGSVFGVLEILSARPNAFRDSDSTVLELVAGFLGAAIAQARAGDELTRSIRSRELMVRVASAVNRATSLDQAITGCLELVARHTDAVVGHALIAGDGETEALVSSGIHWIADGFDPAPLREATASLRVQARQGLLGAVLEERRTIWVEDLGGNEGPRLDAARRSGVNACIAFPVMVADTVVAVIELGLARPTAADPEVMDVTGQIGELLGRAFEREQAAAALRTAEQRFRMMFEHAPIAMVLTSFGEGSRGELIDVNQAMSDLLGRPRDTLIGTNFSSITAPDDIDVGPATFENIDAGATVVELEKRYRHADGRLIACHVVATIVRDAGGAPLYSVTQIRDVGADLEEKRRLSHEALHD